MYLIQTVSSVPIGKRTTGMVEESVQSPTEEKKKWSIGKLFRRKKKETDSEPSSASSDENSQKHNRVKKKKTANKKRSSTPRTNDHVNIHIQNKRSQSVTKVTQKEYPDEGVLSDPSAGFIGYVNRNIPRSPLDHYRYKEHDSFEKRGAGSSCGSQDGSIRKGWKDRIKARAEAKRIFKNDSSSEEESQKSTSSSILKFRSNESLANNSKEGSVSKRSRSARNDRYIKRLSRDEEGQFNKDSELMKNGYCRSEAEILLLNQRVLSTPQINDRYGKIYKEPDYSEPAKLPYDTRKCFSGTQLSGYANVPHNGIDERALRRQPPLSGSNSSVYSYPTTINFNAQVNDKNISYCVPYNTNRNSRTDSVPNNYNFRRSTSVEHNDMNYASPNYENNVMVVKLPLGMPKRETVAPPPPPRDPQRKVSTPLSYMYDNARPLSGSYDSSYQRIARPTNISAYQNNNSNVNSNIYENGQPAIRQSKGFSWSKRPISSSEDQIAVQQNVSGGQNVTQSNPLQRPSSISGEVRPDIYCRFMNRPQVSQAAAPRRHTQENNVNSEYVYLADRTPRSRRPIHIAPTIGAQEQNYANDVRDSASQLRSASDFWKKLDSQELQRRKQFGHNRTLSDQSISGDRINSRFYQSVQISPKTQNVSVQTNSGNNTVNSFRQNGIVKSNVVVKKVNKENEPICYSNIDIIPLNDVRAKSRSSEESNPRRKSTNLEEALSELEAIYNSLGLGDEDLLDRAERQESLATKSAEIQNVHYRQPTVRDDVDNAQRRLSLTDKKSNIPDKVHDDMAYRRLNPHERPKSKDVNNLVSQVSYMLASPLLSDQVENVKKNVNDEPDIVFDDVAYRNIKQANNYLKIEDPQPPFGIPIGPISPAPNSDYLHAVPDSKNRSRFIPYDSPDIVTDDLAFRALRKDCKTVSPINRELTGSIHSNDSTNLSRPSKLFDNHVIKKKRAIRSLSANIFTLIQKEIDDALDMCNEQGLEKSQSIPDLPDAVVEYGKNGILQNSVRNSQSIIPPKIVDSLIKTNPTKPAENKLTNGKVNAELRNEFFKSPIPYSSQPSKIDGKSSSNFNYSQYKKEVFGVQDDLDLMAEEAKQTSANLIIALEELQKNSQNKSNHEEAIKAENCRAKISYSERAESHILEASNNENDELLKNKNEKKKERKTPEKVLTPQARDKDFDIDIEKDIPKKLDLNMQIFHSPSNVKVKGTIPAHIKEKMEEFSKPKRDVDNSADHHSINDIKEDRHTVIKSLTPYKCKGNDTEESLITISNQLNIAGSALRVNPEHNCDILDKEGAKLKELAEKCAMSLRNEDPRPVITTVIEKSVVKPAGLDKNVYKDVEIDHDKPSDCLSPESKSSYMTEIENLKSFDDLRKGISELLDDIGNVSNKLNLPKQPSPSSNNQKLFESKNKVDSKSESCLKSCEEKSSDEDNRNSRESPEYNSSEELAMIFQLNEETPKPSTSKQDLRKINDSHAELNSPRLVKNALRKMSNDEGVQKTSKDTLDDQKQSSTNTSSCNDAPWRKYRRNSSADNVNKGNVLNHHHRSGVERHPQKAAQFPELSTFSAFRPVKPRRLVTETPYAKSKVLKERPFFEDIRIIARGFGEIIEYPKRRGCFESADNGLHPRKGAIKKLGWFKPEQPSQNLTNAGRHKSEACKGRTATTQDVKINVHKGIEYKDIDKRFLSIPQISSDCRVSDLKLPQIFNATVHVDDKLVENLDSHNKDNFKNSSDKYFTSLALLDTLHDSDYSTSDCIDDSMSSGVIGDDVGRAERMQTYKEERRKQLALQSQKNEQRTRTRRNPLPTTTDEPSPENVTNNSKPVTGPSAALSKIRTTRASRLRAAKAASADQALPAKRSDKKLSDGRTNNSRPNSSSSMESSVMVSSASASDSPLNGTVLTSVSDNNLLVRNKEDLVESVGIKAVINDSDNPIGKTSLEEAAREKENIRQPAIASTSCQRGNASRQLPKPSATSPPKDSSNDEISSRRGHTVSSRQGNRSDSDSTKEVSSGKGSPLSSTLVTRQTPQRSLSSSRSSPQSPHSQKLQYKRRSVDLNTKLPISTVSPLKPSSTDAISPHKQVSGGLNPKKSISKTLEKKSNSRELKSENKTECVKNEEELRGNKRLISGISDIRSYKNESNKDKSRDSSKKTDKMVPGVESKEPLNISPSVNLDNRLSNMSSIGNSTSKIDKIRANNSRLSSRMDALAALTKETLARVDRLTKMTEDSQDKIKPESSVATSANCDSHTLPSLDKSGDIATKSNGSPSCSLSSPSKKVTDRLKDIDQVTEHLLDFEKKNAFSSFSKQSSSAKKPMEASSSLLSYTPVSILKRKSSQEEHNLSGVSSGSVSTPPVTFSPSVVDPIPKSRARGQGILKKRRSLDESHVHRRRSCSPEVAFADDYNLDVRPILKSQRRSSLEEVIRGCSPEGQIHGILKRKTSRDSEPYSDDRSLGSPEPQGILKRKSNSSSSSSTTSSHVSIAQAVILAAAGGAEIVEDKDCVKPILKKKSFSEERPSFDCSSDGPRPILKKKSLTESDDNDLEKPKKPILKSSRKISTEDGNTSSFDLSEDDRGSRRSSVLKHRTPDNSECESNVRPILKHPSRDHSQSPRPRLSFCSDDERPSIDESVGQHFVSPSLSILRRLESNNERTSDDDDEEVTRPSRFESGRLHSPSKLKEYPDDMSEPTHSNVTMRRRLDKSKVVARSNSLASNLGNELDSILKSRRCQINDNDSNEASTSAACSNSENMTEGKTQAPKFPSIAERIQCMQKYMGVFSHQSNDQGAIPKKRSAIGRYKTQPITVEELQNISSLELCQANLQRIPGQSSLSSTPVTDVPSVSVDCHKNELEDSKSTSNLASEGTTPSPDPLWDCSKFKNLAASPSQKIVINTFGSSSRTQAFSKVTPSAGSPEYRSPHLSPDLQQSSEISEISSHSSERNQLAAPSTPERNVTSSESVEGDFSFSGNFVPSPQCCKLKKQLSEDFTCANKDSISDSRRSSSVRNSLSHLDKSVGGSSVISEFSRIFKESAKDNNTNFDSLDFSNLNLDASSSLGNNSSITTGENIELVRSFSDLASTTDKKTDEPKIDTTINKAERPKSLFDKAEDFQKGNKETARQELDQLEAELEYVSRVLEADSSALGGADADVWSLNVSIDSGVFNRMSSGDSGPLSAEELSLPQDFSKKPDIVRDHQPPSLLGDKITSPPLEGTPENKFPAEQKETLDSSQFQQVTPTHIHKQPRLDLEYIQNKEKQNEMSQKVEPIVTPSAVVKDDEKCDEPVDSPEQLFGLMKSNSVSARASMWQQLHHQANKPAVKPVLRHSKSRTKDGGPSVLDRFKTQPITMEEVKDATTDNAELIPLNQSKSNFNLSIQQDEDAKLDENDPAKLSIAEKMKLFGATISHRPPVGAVKKPRSPRFQTMPVMPNLVDDALAMNKLKQEELENNSDIHSPKNKIIRLSIPGNENAALDSCKKNALTSCVSLGVLPKKDALKPIKTNEECAEKKVIGANFKEAQNKLAEQASKMMTTEVKGILKSKSGAVPLLPITGEKVPPVLSKSVSPKQDDALAETKLPFTNGKEKKPLRTFITKGGSSEGLKDEGIDSSSDDESASHSSHISNDSCSSSDSSDDFPSGPPRAFNNRGSPEQHLVRPSQLKSCRTESDVQRVLNENVKNDRGVKLPCMDEMRARKIMERCMAKPDKDKTTKTKTPIVKKAPMEKKVETEQINEASVKLKNLRNGNFGINRNIDNSNTSESIITKNNFPILKKKEDADGEYNIPPFMRKFANPVSKSQSLHLFHTQVGRNIKNGTRDKVTVCGDGSGSDGDSSGGREVSQIISKKKHYHVFQPSPEATKLAEFENEAKAIDAPFGKLGRSATQPMSAKTAPQIEGGIAKRLAALQQSGSNDWRKRIENRKSPEDQVSSVLAKNKFNENLNKQTEENKKGSQIEKIDLGADADINSIRNKLEISSQDWKKRVGQHDATAFTVAGRMALESPLANVPPSSPLAPALVAAEDKRTPQPNKFRSRKGDMANSGILKSFSTAAVSDPQSPKKVPGPGDFKRSISVSGVDDMVAENKKDVDDIMTKSEGGILNGSETDSKAPKSAVTPPEVVSKVAIPRLDDADFASFFTSSLQPNLLPHNNNNDIHQPVQNIDLDVIDSESRVLLTGVTRPRANRKIGSSNNHMKVLAARTDIKNEYTEKLITASAAELAANKLQKVALNSPMAVEALAGLASREDFTAINLKKTASSTVLGGNGAERLSSKPLLIHIKGRRKVQVRLIEPVAECVNSGDCFVLVTTSEVYCYNGLYSNVIERTRAADIALHIHNKKDLGCVNSTNVITLDEQYKSRSPKHWKNFWELLGVDENTEEFSPTPAGSIDEDEIYESEMTSTNMCYEVIDDAFEPIKSFWGQTPKISMLDPSKILIFDFGSELYVWNGKNTILENRRRAFQLAQEMWDTGYDYTACLINPINIANGLGDRKEFKDMPKTDVKRPEWAMLAKVTQHMETVLFKDKFLDWPDFTRVIKVKEEEETFKGVAEIKSCNVDVMWNRQYEDPSLELEGSHVGRGTQHYDKETMRHFEVKTKSISKWMIQEYDYIKISPQDLNEFYSGDTYIIRWEYQITVTGRELNGKPSKHNVTGRDRCAYFYWQGKDASANEKGAAALLTVELDHEKGPQVRVTQNNEPPAFLNMFKGHLVIHQGKRDDEKAKFRMYTVRGNVENEAHLVQVTCSMRQLRSRASIIIVDSDNGLIYVWHGCKSLKHTRSVALEAANKLCARKHSDLFNNSVACLKVIEIKEGDEPKSMLDILRGNKRELYNSMLNCCDESPAVTTRLFHFTDLSSQFEAIEILSPLRHESLVTPHPFSQNELYSASQPALFLLDSGDRLWLWQGWWPQQEETESTEAYTGSHRWQVCRRAAMETVLEYWKLSRPGKLKPEAYMAIAGLEPLAFTNLFDDWHNRDDIAEINIAQGYGVGVGEISVAEQLYQLCCTSFPLAVLRQRPLPESVDPAHIERYLSDADFQECFKMSKEEFNELPAWKQANIKKDLGLF